MSQMLDMVLQDFKFTPSSFGPILFYPAFLPFEWGGPVALYLGIVPLAFGYTEVHSLELALSLRRGLDFKFLKRMGLLRVR